MQHTPLHAQLMLQPPQAAGRAAAASGQGQAVQQRPSSAAQAIFACIDASDYMPSVCHHAAWLAERLGADLRLLHASTSRNPRGAVLVRAAERLADEGVPPPGQQLARGAFLEIAAGAAGPGDVLVMGRRGRATRHRPEGVGANVVPLIRRSVASVLVAPRLFIPISRVLVRRTGEAAADTRVDGFVARALAGLEIVTSRPEEVDMICCPRELVCNPGPEGVGPLFALRRPVMVV
jgi:hypothetical protein